MDEPQTADNRKTLKCTLLAFLLLSFPLPPSLPLTLSECLQSTWCGRQAIDSGISLKKKANPHLNTAVFSNYRVITEVTPSAKGRERWTYFLRSLWGPLCSRPATQTELSPGPHAPTWEGCQRLCGHILKLPQFIIALIIQMGPKMYLTKSNWPMLLKRQSGSIPISAANTGFPWVLRGCCINMHCHLIKSKVGLCMDLFWTVNHDYMS